MGLFSFVRTARYALGVRKRVTLAIHFLLDCFREGASEPAYPEGRL